MRERTRLSVIIPNYNNEAYLPQCIESILSQTPGDFELVISDDCSTDGSREIIADYAARDIRINAIYNKQTMQVSKNRHQAIMASSGEFITTLDGDDFYCDRLKLDKELQLILDHKDKLNKDICAFSNTILVDEHAKFTGKQWPDEYIKEGEIFVGIFSRTCSIPRDFTFSRELYNKIGGYDPAFNLYEDWDLKIRLSRISPFYYTGIDGIAYRKRGTGLSYAPYEHHADAIRKIYRKNEAIIRPDEKAIIQKGLSGFLDS